MFIAKSSIVYSEVFNYIIYRVNEILLLPKFCRPRLQPKVSGGNIMYVYISTILTNVENNILTGTVKQHLLQNAECYRRDVTRNRKNGTQQMKY